MNAIHEGLAAGRWHTLSLAEQLGNIGGEVLRVSRRVEDEAGFRAAFERALELFDLTLDDPRWVGRRRELARAREVFCDTVSGGALYHSSFADLIRYFDAFALLARK